MNAIRNRHLVTSEQFQVQVGLFSIYRCPACGGHDIKETYAYCPHCGEMLEFPKKKEEDEEEVTQ